MFEVVSSVVVEDNYCYCRFHMLGLGCLELFSKIRDALQIRV